MEVAPGIHRIEAPLGDRIVCMYLLIGEGGTGLLVDTGLDATPKELLLPYMRQIGLDPGRIRYVLITHADMDHFGGNAGLRETVPGGLFLCPELDRPWIEDLEALIAQRYGEFEKDHGIAESEETKNWMQANARAVPVDLTVTGGEWIRLGPDWRVELLHTPGHTRGHVSVHDPRSHAVIIADAVLGSGLLTRDLAPAFPPTYRYVETYVATIRRLEEMHIEFLLTSHYPVYTGPAAANFLGESRAFVDRVDELLRAELVAATRPLTMREIIERLASQLGRWPESARVQLAYPLQGHLERLARSGLVETSLRGERVAWRWKAA